MEQQADQLHEQHPSRHPPPPLRQTLRLSLNGAINMGTWDQILRIIKFPTYWQA
jgi:hypothetical protein